MTSSERILAILTHHKIEWPYPAEETELRRTRAGRWQLSAGAWRWFLWPVPGTHLTSIPDIGSSFRAATVIKHPIEQTSIYVNQFGQIEILVEGTFSSR